MAKFIINEGLTTGVQTVEAEQWVEDGTFVVFYDADDNRVFAIPVKSVHTIKRRGNNTGELADLVE